MAGHMPFGLYSMEWKFPYRRKRGSKHCKSVHQMTRALAKMLVITSRDAEFTSLSTRQTGKSAYGCPFIDYCAVVYTLDFSLGALTRASLA